MAKRRLILSVSLAVLAAAGCGCSGGSAASTTGSAKASARDAPSTGPTASDHSSTTTTTTAPPSGVPTTVPLPASTVPGWTSPLTTLPPGGGFSSLSCISDTFCIALGGGTGGQASTEITGSGVSVSWDGASWSDPSVYFPAPTSGPVTAPVLPDVDCTSGPTCVIVDGSDHVSEGNGTMWGAPAPLPPGPDLAANPSDPGSNHPGSRDDAVSCPTPTFCAVVDNTGHAYTWSGGAWLPTRSLGLGSGAGETGPVTSLYQAGRVGISCPTTRFCEAVVGTSVLDWNGTSWSVEPTPWTPSLAAGSASTAIACPSPTLCAVVNGSGLRYRNGSGTWSPVETIDPGGNLDAISCPTTTFCMAADSGGSVMLWDGSSWAAPRQVIPSATQYPGAGTSLSCPTKTSCMVMNADGDFATYSAG